MEPEDRLPRSTTRGDELLGSGDELLRSCRDKLSGSAGDASVRGRHRAPPFFLFVLEATNYAIPFGHIVVLPLDTLFMVISSAIAPCNLLNRLACVRALHASFRSLLGPGKHKICRVLSRRRNLLSSFACLLLCHPPSCTLGHKVRLLFVVPVTCHSLQLVSALLAAAMRYVKIILIALVFFSLQKKKEPKFHN